MKYLWILLVVFTCGCSYRNSTVDFVPYVKQYTLPTGDNIWVLRSKDGSTPTRRAILVHGMTMDHTMWENGNQPSSFLVEHMWHESGWEMIMLDLPYTKEGPTYPDLVNMLQDTSNPYVTYWQNRLQAIFDYADTNFEKVQTTAMIGVSWGGLHTLMGAALMPQVSTYVVFVPVVDISALIGFYNIEVPTFEPTTQIPVLATKKGYMAWAGEDTAVLPSWTNAFQASLSAAAGSNFSVTCYPEYVHEETNTMMEYAFPFVDAIGGAQ